MVNLNFEFAESAIQYLESEDDDCIKKTSNLAAADHIYFHAYNCNPEMKFDNKTSFIKHILSKNSLKNNVNNYKNILEQIKKSNGLTQEIEKETLKYLPDGTSFSTNMYITLGYFPEGINGNFNIDLSSNFNNIRDVLYSSIHELHHVGFFKYSTIPFSLENLKLKRDLSDLISSHFQLEGLATYAPYNIRSVENSLNHIDYKEINNISLMNECKTQLFNSYDSLEKSPDSILEESDFDILDDFWDGKRIAYRFGLYSCIKISKKYGEHLLIDTIKDKPSEFMKLVRSIY